MGRVKYNNNTKIKTKTLNQNYKTNAYFITISAAKTKALR